jgi:hypothetical protein
MQDLCLAFYAACNQANADREMLQDNIKSVCDLAEAEYGETIIAEFLRIIGSIYKFLSWRCCLSVKDSHQFMKLTG